jgi:hypothetical protein
MAHFYTRLIIRVIEPSASYDPNSKGSEVVRRCGLNIRTRARWHAVSYRYSRITPLFPKLNQLSVSRRSARNPVGLHPARIKSDRPKLDNSCSKRVL